MYKPYTDDPDLTPGKLTKNHFIAPDRFELPLRKFEVENPKAIVIALHGFNDYGNAFKDTAQSFNKRRISVIAYDQRGFGETSNTGSWSGASVMAGDLYSLCAAVRKDNPKTPLYILGDSMGGAVAILASTRNPPIAVDGAILIAPAVWGRSTMNPVQVMALWFSAHTMPWLSLDGKGLGLVPSDNREMLKKLSADKLVRKGARTEVLYGMADLMDAALDKSGEIRIPTLIAYGARDEIIPKPALREMVKRLPDSDHWQFLWYDDGYHMLLRDLTAKDRISDIASWIENKGVIKNPHGQLFNAQNRDQMGLF